MAEKQNPKWLPPPSKISNQGYYWPSVTFLFSVRTCRPMQLVQISQKLADIQPLVYFQDDGHRHLVFYRKLDFGPQ